MVISNISHRGRNVSQINLGQCDINVRIANVVTGTINALQICDINR